MGNQVRLAELPPLDITEEESGLATVRVNMSGYPIHSAAYNNTAELVCRERQLLETLAQLREATERAERAERAERERDEAVRVGRHLCKRLGDEFGITITEEWSRAVIDGEHDKPLPPKLAAVPDAEGAD